MSLSHYPPLPQTAGQNFIRLLILQPGLSDDSVACKLRVANISDLDDHQGNVYDALSYAWGAEEPKFDITIDAWLTPVRSNLWHCLRQIRHTRRELSLWVDALCINQQDPQERASQVQVMSQVYRKARRVMVWLGSSDDDSVRAMQMIRELSMSSFLRIKNTEALLAWSQRSYWTRTWVVQEFLLARDVVLICGPDTLEWSTAERFLRRIEMQSVDGGKHTPSFWWAFRDTAAYHLMQQRAKSSNHLQLLSTLLIRNRGTHCQDPRDKVYAMLGLSSDFDRRKAIRISYTKDLRMLLFEVLTQLEVQPKDVLRWTRFLIDTLEIGQGATWTTPFHASGREEPSGPSRAKNWRVSGFSTGEIIDHRRIPESLDLNDIGKELDDFVGAHGNDRKLNSSEAIAAVDQNDVLKLKAARAHLITTTGRTSHHGSNANSGSGKTQQSEDSATFLAIVYTPDCLQPEVFPAVGYGIVRKGDIVIQFLGNEIAIVMDPGRPDIGITGCLLFPHSGRKGAVGTIDPVTNLPYLRRVLRSEADCSDSTRSISLQMTQAQLLALAL